ncbi:MAG: thiamine pyrophosphate-binding protein [Hyphomicrobiales bacterium]|nr:thiamine pyrophosphate-binding protein [Hyphomicrobiales bacterium]
MEGRPDPTARRAAAIAEAGSLEAALAAGTLAEIVAVPLAEAVILGLLRQDVRKYLAIFGHGNTALGEALRVYEKAGVTRTWQFRNEVAMAHAATQLSWQYGEVPAVLTSIGPGALQAFAASLVAASNGVGVYHLYGDETTGGEGYNMQQVPQARQGAFGALAATMGRSYTLHTPEALREALRQGNVTVRHPFKPGPYYLLLPINTQPRMVTVNLAALPVRSEIPPVACADDGAFAAAAVRIGAHDRIVIKAGGGTLHFAARLREFTERIGAAVVLSPGSTGVLPDDHPQNMHVGGSKGSISGNYAMEEATLLIAVGTRAVCQSDCSGIGYPRVSEVINLNGDLDDLTHYNRTLALAGDIGSSLDRLIAALADRPVPVSAGRRAWLDACALKKREWSGVKRDRIAATVPIDPAWQRPVMTQPQAIEAVASFAKRVGAVKLFDAGDVQANGFQIVEDDHPFETFTEAGASYMGYAVSGLMAAAIAERPAYTIAFTGDGSFMMNPQILLDAIEHGLRATIVIFDNRRMAAISGLQAAQYGVVFRTGDSVAVDYVRLASAFPGVLAIAGGETAESLLEALTAAYDHPGLAVIHVPVYGGGDEMGGMGAYGAWNVGNWVEDVEARYAQTVI